MADFLHKLGKIIAIGFLSVLHLSQGALLGTATISAGNNYPTSSYTFADDDVINSGDLNKFSTYMGIRSATDTISLQGQIYNVSTTANLALSTSTYMKIASSGQDMQSSSTFRTALGYSAGNKMVLSSTGTIGVATNSISQWVNDAGYSASGTAGAMLIANNGSDINSTSTFRKNLGYTSSSQITIASTGTLIFATTSIKQFNNDAGFVTSTSATGITATGTESLPGTLTHNAITSSTGMSLYTDGTQRLFIIYNGNIQPGNDTQTHNDSVGIYVDGVLVVSYTVFSGSHQTSDFESVSASVSFITDILSNATHTVKWYGNDSTVGTTNYGITGSGLAVTIK